MVYVTGDCHGKYGKFNEDIFPEQKEMTRDDFVIVCGDFGLWHDNKTERYWLNWLSEKPFTILFVDGNHENFDRLYSDEFEIVDFHDGKAHKIRDNIYHLMRGYIFNLCGKQFFAFGGASSHDIRDGVLFIEDYNSEQDMLHDFVTRSQNGEQLRINHYSWWEREIPTKEEMDFGLSTLKENNNKVNFIISHCCPQNIASYFSGGAYKVDNLTHYFDTIDQTVEFDKWFFGHYHFNDKFFNKYIVLYEQIMRVV